MRKNQLFRIAPQLSFGLPKSRKIHFKDKQEDNENDQLKKDADNDLKNAKKCWGKW